jgi:DNA-binding MarR family transcriptional regulator
VGHPTCILRNSFLVNCKPDPDRCRLGLVEWPATDRRERTSPVSSRPPGQPIALGDLAARLGVAADPDLVDFALRFTRLVRLNTLALDNAAADAGLTTAESVVLSALAAAGPPHVLSPTALHGVVVQTPGGITKTLRRLEDANLVTRATDPDDRRALHVELTARGFERAGQVLERTMAHYANLVEDVSADDLRTFASVSVSLLAVLEAQLGYRSSASTP